MESRQITDYYRGLEDMSVMFSRADSVETYTADKGEGGTLWEKNEQQLSAVWKCTESAVMLLCIKEVCSMNTSAPSAKIIVSCSIRNKMIKRSYRKKKITLFAVGKQNHQQQRANLRFVANIAEHD